MFNDLESIQLLICLIYICQRCWQRLFTVARGLSIRARLCVCVCVCVCVSVCVGV